MTSGDLPPIARTAAYRPTALAFEKGVGKAMRFLRSRRGMMLIAAFLLALGAAFNWSWLVAAGIAPILLAVLPCLAMCGLGLCMNRSGAAGGSCGKTSDNRQTDSSSPGSSA